MMDSVTHIAAPFIIANGRTIQRCALCGEKLIDDKNCAMPLKPDGTADSIGTWEAMRLVRVTVGNPQRWELLPDSDKLPEDSCLVLIE